MMVTVSSKATEALLEDLRAMARIRAFETRVARQFREGNIPGFVHVSIGQEAVARGRLLGPRASTTTSPPPTAATATASPRAPTRWR